MRWLLVILLIALLAPHCKAQKDPFADIRYDSVVAYNFGMHRMRTSILKKDSTLDETTILPGRRLTANETNSLLNKLTNKKTYGGAPMACFEPKHAFIFYSGKSIAGIIELCFECNQISSTPAIPAVTYYYEKKGRTVSNYGFSEKGVTWLMDFCKSIGLQVPARAFIPDGN